jgi:hypothetical protein
VAGLDYSRRLPAKQAPSQIEFPRWLWILLGAIAGLGVGLAFGLRLLDVQPDAASRRNALALGLVVGPTIGASFAYYFMRAGAAVHSPHRWTLPAASATGTGLAAAYAAGLIANPAVVFGGAVGAGFATLALGHYHEFARWRSRAAPALVLRHGVIQEPWTGDIRDLLERSETVSVIQGRPYRWIELFLYRPSLGELLHPDPPQEPIRLEVCDIEWLGGSRWKGTVLLRADGGAHLVGNEVSFLERHVQSATLKRPPVS